MPTCDWLPAQDGDLQQNRIAAKISLQARDSYLQAILSDIPNELGTVSYYQLIRKHLNSFVFTPFRGYTLIRKVY